MAPSGRSRAKAPSERRLPDTRCPNGGAVPAVPIADPPAADGADDRSTDAAQALRRLEASEARYRSLVQAQVHDVWQTDADGMLTSDMPTWRRVTGQAEADLLGFGWLAGIHPEDRARIAAEWDAAVRDRLLCACEYRICPPGTTDDRLGDTCRVFSVRVVPVLRGDAVVEWVGTSVDVTDRRLADRDNERLQELARLAADRTRALQQVTARLSGALTVAQVLTAILEEGGRQLGALGSGVALLDVETETVRYHSLTGYDTETTQQWMEFPLSEHSPVTTVLRSGEPLYITGRSALLERFTTERMRHFYERSGERAWVRLPLRTSGAPFGVLGFGFAEERGFGTDEREFLLTLASQCSQALERAGLYERAEERARLQSVLSEASHLLSGSLDRDEILARLVRLTVPAVADWASVHLVSEDGSTALAAVVHRDPAEGATVRQFLEWFPSAIEQPVGIAETIRTGRSVLVAGVSDEVLQATTSELELRALRRLATGSALVVPLTARGRTLGALTLVRESAPRYSETQLGFAEDLARRGALAMDNAALFATQRDVAVTLQRSLLPQSLPKVDGLSLAARYLPGTDGTEVGGDWYDAIELPGGRVGLVVGDVMGRGVRAAAVMGQLRAALRGYALEGHPPAEVLRRLDLVVQAFDDLQLTTCLYGVYEPESRLLRLSAAGHLPPLLVYPDGGASYLEVQPGLPLGVGGGDFTEARFVLPRDATLMLYTDGLVESREVAVDDGMEQLRTLLADFGAASPDAAHERALQGMGRDAGHDDDVAVLVVHIGDTRPVETGERRTLRLELSPSPVSARTARTALTEALLEWGFRVAVGDSPAAAVRGVDAIDTAMLLTSELVANAVLHAGTPLELVVHATCDILDVSVFDESLDPPLAVLDARSTGGPRPTGEEPAAEGPAASAGDLVASTREGGRGLWLLDALADEWGVDVLPTGKRVWFRLHL